MDSTTEIDASESTVIADAPKRSRQAVEAPRRSYFMMEPDELVIIGLDTEDGPEHFLYDERIKLPIEEAFVRNIMAFGIFTPIIAIKDGDRTLVSAGRRRVRHARVAAQRQKEAGLEVVKVPVIFKRDEDRHLFGISRAENALRTNDGPLDNARNAKRMLDMGASLEEVAVTFGVTTHTVNEWQNLLTLSPKVKAAVENRTISATAASKLSTLSREDQNKQLDELVAAGARPSVEKVAQKVRETQGKAPSQTPRSRIAKAESLLRKAAPDLGEMKKDDLVDLIDRLSKALLSKGIAKLVD